MQPPAAHASIYVALTYPGKPRWVVLACCVSWFKAVLYHALSALELPSRKIFAHKRTSGSALSGLTCTRRSPLIENPVEIVRLLAWYDVFVPVWMAPMMLKNFRLIAAQSSPVSPLGQLDYREGWFAIIPKEGQPGETLCGIQVHLNDKSLAEFPNRDWPAIDFFFFLLRAPFGQYGPVAAFELYLYTAVGSRPGPGRSRTTASCQP